MLAIKENDRIILSNIPKGCNYQDTINNIVRTMIKNNYIIKNIISYCGYNSSILTKEFYELNNKYMIMVLKIIVSVGYFDTYIKNCENDNDLYNIAGAEDKEDKMWLEKFLKNNHIVSWCYGFKDKKRYYVNPYVFKDTSEMLMKDGFNDLLFKAPKRIKKIKPVLIDSVIEIYKITNLINGKCYIGQTRRGLYIRFEEHCINDSKVGRAIKKYGKDNFYIELLATTNDPNKADYLETKFIKEFDSFKNGYNATKTGRGIKFLHF